jgi:hypothetical protein
VSRVLEAWCRWRVGSAVGSCKRVDGARRARRDSAGAVSAGWAYRVQRR